VVRPAGEFPDLPDYSYEVERVCWNRLIRIHVLSETVETRIEAKMQPGGSRTWHKMGMRLPRVKEGSRRDRNRRELRMSV
jgi:hypothetical protein